MGPLGIHLELMVGPTVPVPAPHDVTSALKSVEIRHSDEGRSGFQLQFEAGRDGPIGVADNPMALNPLLSPFNRVIVMVTFDVMPVVLIDGVITNSQLAASNHPGASTLTLTGEDVSVMLDMEEKSAEWLGMPDPLIATLIILSYAQYGLIPMVIPPPISLPPNPVESVPVQQGTDLSYLRDLAAFYGYVFFVIPGPAPGTNTAYWGPNVPLGAPLPALRIGTNPQSNVASMNFTYDALKPELVEGQNQDPTIGADLPVRSIPTVRPPLALRPAVVTQFPNVRRRQYRDSGASTPEALASAQGTTDASTEVVQGTGEVDALRYGRALFPRSLVGVAGAGLTYDGLYYVKQVSHSITRSHYKQSVTLTREGLTTTVPAVVP
jgi:hypothetical protein